MSISTALEPPNTMNKSQDQATSEGSTALQAGGDIVIKSMGVTYTEVKEIALDIFRANFYQLAGAAQDAARARAEEITDAFFSKLQAEHPEGLQQAGDPDFQYALLTAQKEHARVGDKDLGDLLVDLLVDRTKQHQRDILQIVLDESLSTAPKLTDNQLAVLSVIFLFKYTQNFGIGNHHALGQYFDKFLKPLTGKIVDNAACYQHLEFTGCGTVSMGSIDLETILGTNYQGQFIKGFERTEVTARDINIPVNNQYFIQCFNDAARLQVRANSQELLMEHLEKDGIAPEERDKMKQLFDVGKMTNDEIREKCIALRPYMANVFKTWSGSQMKHFTLTSVGIAIAHANIKRFAGEFANLAIWIN